MHQLGQLGDSVEEMGSRWCALMLAACACGRVGFDTLTGSGDGGGGTSPFPDSADPSAMQQVLTVTSRFDDGEIEPFLLYEAGENNRMLYVGAWSNEWTWTYVRFTIATDIPAGATITA